MDKNVYIIILLLLGVGIFIESRIRISDLQKQVAGLKSEVGHAYSSANRISQKMEELEARAKKSEPGQQLWDCNFIDSKYLVLDMGFVNFERTDHDSIKCSGKIKGKKIDEFVRIIENTIQFHNENIKLELFMAGNCSKIEGFLTWKRADESWEIDDVLLIKN